MTRLQECIFTALMIIAWMVGIVIAKGWQLLFCIIPFYAWYLVVEKLLLLVGWA